MRMVDGAFWPLSVKFNKPLIKEGVRCCLPNHPKWESQERGVSVQGQKSEESGSQEQLRSAGVVGPSLCSGAARAEDSW